MNWDISIGRYKLACGRALQFVGGRLGNRKLILDGEAMEYAGRLQMRYGMLKHEAQWNGDALRLRRIPIPVKK